jgi:hypothetical protein
MPLLDHFHPSLLRVRRFESSLTLWACALADSLSSDQLPKKYFTEVRTRPGRTLEVGSFDPDNAEPWAPSSARFSFPAIFPDAFEVFVFEEGSGTPVGAVELVSPGNKNRPEARRAFAAKCSSYLQAGVGLAIVDIVTNPLANLHDKLVDLLEIGDGFKMPSSPSIYATAYHPLRRGDADAIDVWLHPLAVGEPLPTIPLFLRAGPCLPLELEATYFELCRRARLV